MSKTTSYAILPASSTAALSAAWYAWHIFCRSLRHGQHSKRVFVLQVQRSRRQHRSWYSCCSVLTRNICHKELSARCSFVDKGARYMHTIPDLTRPINSVFWFAQLLQTVQGSFRTGLASGSYNSIKQFRAVSEQFWLLVLAIPSNSSGQFQMISCM